MPTISGSVWDDGIVVDVAGEGVEAAGVAVDGATAAGTRPSTVDAIDAFDPFASLYESSAQSTDANIDANCDMLEDEQVEREGGAFPALDGVVGAIAMAGRTAAAAVDRAPSSIATAHTAAPSDNAGELNGGVNKNQHAILEGSLSEQPPDVLDDHVVQDVVSADADADADDDADDDASGTTNSAMVYIVEEEAGGDNIAQSKRNSHVAYASLMRALREMDDDDSDEVGDDVNIVTHYADGDGQDVYIEMQRQQQGRLALMEMRDKDEPDFVDGFSAPVDLERAWMQMKTSDHRLIILSVLFAIILALSITAQLALPASLSPLKIAFWLLSLFVLVVLLFHSWRWIRRELRHHDDAHHAHARRGSAYMSYVDDDDDYDDGDDV